MRDIAIIGAGELGGTLAHALARRQTVAAVRLIDERGRAAEGKALDLMHAAPVEGFATQLSGSTDLMAAGGADVVILADRAGDAEWHGEEGLRLVRRLGQIAPGAIVVCAGPSQRDLVDRAARELHVSRRHIFGTAPEALASGARALAALALDCSPRDVALTVIGNPPGDIVVPWDAAACGGYSLVRLIGEPVRRQLTARLQALWPPGPHALSAAVVRTIDAVFGRTRQMVSCFVAPDIGAGEQTRTAALPVRVGPQGIEAVIVPPLSVVDRVALDNAMLL